MPANILNTSKSSWSTILAYNKNISPVGWYVGSYLLRFVELKDKRRNKPEEKFISWENTVLVKASSLDTAYTKVEKIGKQHSKPYRGGPDGVPVRWEYLGVTELLPIYEQIGDGAEIAWTERAPTTLRKLKKIVKPKGSFRQ